MVRAARALALRTLGVSLCALAGLATAASAQLSPEPLAVARVFAERYPQTASVSYIPTLSWSGSLRLAELTGESAWRERARVGIQTLLEGPAPTDGTPYSLTRLAGYAAAADLGRIEGDAAAMARARAAADLVIPVDDSAVVRFATGWTDDMYMATSLLTRVSGEGVERARATVATLLTAYVERLQRPDGLFVHAVGAPHAWGRGNGFAALGLSEALMHLPDSPERSRALDAFRRQMQAFVVHQSDDGSWRQVVDEPTSYRELSVTSMTVAAMARGVRHGWLDAATFLPVIDRGWRAVLARIGDDGSVRDVCTSTGAGPTLAYYLERPSVNGMDDRGGGLVLVAALEMEELRRRGR